MMATVEEKIKVMQAFAEGKRIMCRGICSTGKATPILAPTWNWAQFEYFIQEDPKLIAVIGGQGTYYTAQHGSIFVRNDGQISPVSRSLKQIMEIAPNNQPVYEGSEICVKVIE